MTIYASTDLKQNLGEVLLSVDQKPAIITRYRRNRYIIMSVEFYKRHFAKSSNDTPAPPKATILNGVCPELDKAMAEFQIIEMKDHSDQVKATLHLSEPKEALNMRVDKGVLEFFKNTGRGYQSRINAVLRAFKEAHSVSKDG